MYFLSGKVPNQTFHPHFENPDEKYQLIKEIVDRRIAEMYVTPKDVDETIKYISYTISEGLNILWSENI